MNDLGSGEFIRNETIDSTPNQFLEICQITRSFLSTKYAFFAGLIEGLSITPPSINPD